MKIPLTIISLTLLTGLSAFAQSIKGTVSVKEKDAIVTIPGVNIYWQKAKEGVAADVNGSFKITYPAELPDHLIISMTGYKADTLYFTVPADTTLKVLLRPVVLKEVVVEGKSAAISLSTIDPINVQKITTDELRKAACCNLSESFETNASVDVNYTDAVSGAKQIQMLGLDGVYTQILSENVPLIRGLSSSYGLSYTPGTWINSILVTKGTGSVVNGYESITGQLQLELIEPAEAEKLMFNGYANSQGRYEGNIHYGLKASEKVSSVLFAHYSTQVMPIDKNGDLFVDMPLTTQYNVLNRWTIDKPGKYCIQLGIKGLYEEREGGTMPENMMNENGHNHSSYNISIDNRQYEFFSKTGIMFPQPYKSLGIITSLRHHERSSVFGNRDYDGRQESVYLNSIYETIISDTRHKIRTGASFVGDIYDETFMDSSFTRDELVPGVFGEYTYSNGESVSVVAGMRFDQHNLYGTFYSPRVHFKYNFPKGTTFRISAGKGYRTANVFVENSQVFASSRRIIVSEKLLPEEAWNGGITLIQKIKMFGREGTINLDAYRTQFENQVVVDLENPRQVVFHNLHGRSFSNSYQLELNQEIIERLDVRLAGKIYQVWTDYNTGMKERPLVPRERALFNIGYKTLYDKWKFDFTTKWTGRSRLPNTKGNPQIFRLPENSPSYFYLSAQITRAFKHFEVYLGSENITNFTQKSPILASTDPYGPFFDASMIWGPVGERMFYGGIRYSIK